MAALVIKWVVVGRSRLIPAVLGCCGLFYVVTSFTNDDKNQSIDLKWVWENGLITKLYLSMENLLN